MHWRDTKAIASVHQSISVIQNLCFQPLYKIVDFGSSLRTTTRIRSCQRRLSNLFQLTTYDWRIWAWIKGNCPGLPENATKKQRTRSRTSPRPEPLYCHLKDHWKSQYSVARFTKKWRAESNSCRELCLKKSELFFLRGMLRKKSFSRYTGVAAVHCRTIFRSRKYELT